MNIACLDLEGVLVPEIWIEFAHATNISELRRTTRDEPDYHKLMDFRIATLAQHGLGIKEIQEVISGIDPLPGAQEFLAHLREQMQVVIISDTFEEFARPLMQKLGWPTILCNSLVLSGNDVVGIKMRCKDSKLTTVRALQSAGLETIATGDSYNDLAMIRASKAGFLFCTTDQIRRENPDLAAYETYDELLGAFVAAAAAPAPSASAPSAPAVR
ncbi:MAG: bifunctional phosphoserine phosphatase/homoserine phosphotransferase ThrH [Atopobiaceae bacterium]|jgi:phosphoserine/homoserine phosphotransferase